MHVDPADWDVLVIPPADAEAVRSALANTSRVTSEVGGSDPAVVVGRDTGDGLGLAALSTYACQRVLLVPGDLPNATRDTWARRADLVCAEPLPAGALRVAVLRGVQRHVEVQQAKTEIAALRMQLDALGRQVRERTQSLAELTERQRRQSVTDGVTGLHNHRHFQESWRAEVRRSKRYGQSVSLILMDVDHFAGFNATHGHTLGDRLLKAMALLLRSSVRDVDLVSRYAGGEFAVALPETGKEPAVMLAGRLAAAIAEYPFEHREDQPGGRVTVSVGVSCFPDDGESSNQVLQSALNARARAKAQGRAQVVAASEAG